MRDVADGRLEASATFAEEMSYCLGCLACQTACPAGVDYATLLEAARGEVERSGAAGGLRRRLVRWLTLDLLFRRPRLLRAAGRVLSWYERSGLQSTLRRSDVMRRYLPSGFGGSRRRRRPCGRRFRTGGFDRANGRSDRCGVRALLTGCVQDLVYPHVNRATADVLAGERLRSGHAAVAVLLRIAARSQWRTRSWRAISPAAISTCSTSTKWTRSSPTPAVAARTSSTMANCSHDDPQYRRAGAAWDAQGARHPRVARGDRLPAAAHAGRVSRERAAGESRLRRLVPFAAWAENRAAAAGRVAGRSRRRAGRARRESDWCCGSGGDLHAHAAGAVGEAARAKARITSRRAGAAVVATANPGCLLQLEQGMRADARLADVRVCHPVELLAEAYRREAAGECGSEPETRRGRDAPAR